MKRQVVLIYICVGLVIIVGSIFFISCQASDKNDVIPGNVRIGAIIPLTGEVATYGESLRRGFQLAAAQFAGRVEIIYEDSQAVPKVGLSAMKKLLDQGVRHFLGDATSGVCLVLAPLAEQNHALLMISIATSDELTNSGPYVFRNCPPNRKQAEVAAAFIRDELGASRVAVLAKLNPYGVNLASQFRADANDLGLEVVLDEQYEASVRDFSTIIGKLQSADVEAVFAPGNYEETALILRTARELGFSVPFIGTDGAYSPKLMQLAGTAAEEFYLTMLGADHSSEFYKQFAAAYIAKYESDPDIFTAYGYEGAMILFRVAIAGGTLADQQDLIQSQTWEGLFGDVSFNENGEIERSVQILAVRDADFHVYEQLD